MKIGICGPRMNLWCHHKYQEEKVAEIVEKDVSSMISRPEDVIVTDSNIGVGKMAVAASIYRHSIPIVIYPCSGYGKPHRLGSRISKICLFPRARHFSPWMSCACFKQIVKMSDMIVSYCIDGHSNLYIQKYAARKGIRVYDINMIQGLSMCINPYFMNEAHMKECI